jgi:kynurenine formamidase
MLAEPMRIVDLTLPVFPGAPAFPGDPMCQFDPHNAVATAGYNVTRVCLGTHQGTHLDAPRHFFDDGATVDQLDLRRCVGPAALLDFSHKRPGDEIAVADLLPFEALARPGARLIYRLGWDRFFGEGRYFVDFPGLTVEAAQWLADRKIALIGSDAPGPNATAWAEVHRPLLAAGVVIVEALAHLDQIASPTFYFVAAPLKLQGLDGSPIRAFAIE